MDKQPIPCPYCRGTGKKPRARECNPCIGTGKIQPQWQNYNLAVKRSKA